MPQPAPLPRPSRPVLSRRKKIWFAVATGAMVAAVCVLIYLSFIVWRCSRYLARHSRWVGSVYNSDTQFGYFPKPHASAFHALRQGDQIPVLFDADGFRIPVDKASPGESASPKQTPADSILFLGCSFTHGYGVPAEKTFAQLAADDLDMKCLNAGVSGWGLSQMLLRARHEIPRLRPRHVVVQYANWLVSRSQAYYGPTDFGLVPTPYFSRQSNRTDIHPPVFRPLIHDLLLANPERQGLLAFTRKVGLPLFLHDDVLGAWTSTKGALGLLPPPLADRQEILSFALEEIRELCETHGGHMSVLMLRNAFDDVPRDTLEAAKYHLIDTFEPLAAALPERTPAAWSKSYYHWRGTPLRLVDMHPSPRAHAIIAKTIAQSLREAGSDKP